MACINCPTQKEEPTPVTPAPAVSLAVSPGGSFYTGRQFVGGAGFDSPFDLPSPTLDPVPAIVVPETFIMRLSRITPLILAVLAAGVGYLIYETYQKRRRA